MIFDYLGGPFKTTAVIVDGKLIAKIRKTTNGAAWYVDHNGINGHRFFNTKTEAKKFIKTTTANDG